MFVLGANKNQHFAKLKNVSRTSKKMLGNGLPLWHDINLAQNDAIDWLIT